MLFTSLGLSDPILKAIEETGYTAPTPIQAKAIPLVLEGKDVLAAAQTGTGKTAQKIPKEVVKGFEVDPSIAAEPIKQGGGRGRRGGGGQSRNNNSSRNRSRSRR